MAFTLGTAAQATGMAKSSILRAFKAGRSSASRTEDGSWSIDPVELGRVFPLLSISYAGEIGRPQPDATTDVLVAELRAPSRTYGATATTGERPSSGDRWRSRRRNGCCRRRSNMPHPLTCPCRSRQQRRSQPTSNRPQPLICPPRRSRPQRLMRHHRRRTGTVKSPEAQRHPVDGGGGGRDKDSRAPVRLNGARLRANGKAERRVKSAWRPRSRIEYNRGGRSRARTISCRLERNWMPRSIPLSPTRKGRSRPSRQSKVGSRQSFRSRRLPSMTATGSPLRSQLLH